MKPLYPAVFNIDECKDRRWLELTHNFAFKNYIFSVCREFPSLVLAASARSELAGAIADIADGLVKTGINVFIPADPVPLCALAQAVSSRNMPLGLFWIATRRAEYTMSALPTWRAAGRKGFPAFVASTGQQKRSHRYNRN
jgi:hypothetical protein